MNGYIVTNKYYFDEGLNHCIGSLKSAFLKKGIRLDVVKPYFFCDGDGQTQLLHGSFKTEKAFVIFLDKDICLLSQLEKLGLKTFNNSFAVSTTDDKIKTYLTALDGTVDASMPKTISAPKMYDVIETDDDEFLSNVEKNLSFPLIAKENTGSQGRQVYLIDSAQELKRIYYFLKKTPHHYQQFLGQKGADLRVYVVGHKPIAACTRQGTCFKSNMFDGGLIKLADLDKAHEAAAIQISKKLSLDFGSIDFLIPSQTEVFKKPVFLEANSNAYFKGIEGLGVDIATHIADHVLSQI